MNKKPVRSVISTGTTSIVLIFVLLCMLTFSVLSLVSAQADLRLSRLSAQRTTDYYAAENTANEILIHVENAAAEAAAEPESEPAEAEDGTVVEPEDFSASVLRRLDEADGVTRTRDGRLTYEVPLGETQALRVELSVSRTLSERGRHYTIHAWQTVSAYDWTPDESMHLAMPDTFPFGLG